MEKIQQNAALNLRHCASSTRHYSSAWCASAHGESAMSSMRDFPLNLGSSDSPGPWKRSIGAWPTFAPGVDMAAFWNHMDQVMKRGHYGHYHEELFFLKDPVFGCDGMIFCLKCTSILDLHAIYIYIY